MISNELKLNLRNKYIESKCWGEETFGKMLERIANDYNDKIALKDEFMSITYSECLMKKKRNTGMNIPVKNVN